MTIYERFDRILSTYHANYEACISNGLVSAARIIDVSIDALEVYMADMPIEIAEMYAGENE